MAEPQGQELKGTPGSRLAPSGTNLLYPGVEESLELPPTSWGSPGGGVPTWTVLSPGLEWWAQGVH